MTPDCESSPTVAILSLLDAYQESHQKGSASLKDTIWNLTKARQSKRVLLSTNNTVLAATDVREELRPRAVLMRVKEVSGKQEEIDVPVLTVVDPLVQKEESSRSEQQQHEPDLVPEGPTNEGLRQRKNATPKESDQLKWTVEKNVDEGMQQLTEEERLERMDPLSLFGGGLNPPSLRVAQLKARETLNAFIQAANVKRVLEMKLKEEQGH